jgi:regulatory protein spx
MEFSYRNILKEPLGGEELSALAAQGNFPVTELINKKSKALVKLDVNVSELTEDAAAKLLGQEPRIMHRPLFSDGKKLVVGFKADKMKELEALLG